MGATSSTSASSSARASGVSTCASTPGIIASAAFGRARDPVASVVTLVRPGSASRSGRGWRRALPRSRCSRARACAGSRAAPRRGTGAPRPPGSAAPHPPTAASMRCSPSASRTTRWSGQCMKAGKSIDPSVPAMRAVHVNGVRIADLHDPEPAVRVMQHGRRHFVDAGAADVALRDDRVRRAEHEACTAAPCRRRGRAAHRRPVRGRSAGRWEPRGCANRSRPRRGAARRSCLRRGASRSAT